MISLQVGTGVKELLKSFIRSGGFRFKIELNKEAQEL
jgi:hypothetical protein